MRKKRTPPPRHHVGKDELHFAENPIALLSDRQSPDQAAITTVRLVEGKNGEVIEAKWNVTGSEQHGLPISSDLDIYLILMELTKEQGFENRTIYFSRYEIVRRLKGLTWSDPTNITVAGKDYKRIQDSLNRLVGVTIYAERWYDATLKKHGSYSFHVLENAFLFDENPGRKKTTQNQAPLRLSYITWDDTFFRNLQAGYVKTLDLVKYFSLSSSISKSLYRYLDKRFYDGKAKFEIGLRYLAHEHLGLSRNYEYDSKIKAKMEKAHEELVEAGIIGGYEYRNGHDGLIVTYFAPRATQQLPKKNPKEVLDLHGPEEREPVAESAVPGSIVDELVAAGLGRDIGERFAEIHPEDYLRLKVAYLPYASAKNPGGWLRRAIEGDWQAPPGYKKAQKDAERQQKLSEQKGQSQRRANVEAQAAEDRARQITAVLSSMSEAEIETLRTRAAEAARERHKKAAEAADRGKGVRVWEGLVQRELERLLLEEHGSPGR